MQYIGSGIPTTPTLSPTAFAAALTALPLAGNFKAAVELHSLAAGFAQVPVNGDVDSVGFSGMWNDLERFAKKNKFQLPGQRFVADGAVTPALIDYHARFRMPIVSYEIARRCNMTISRVAESHETGMDALDELNRKGMTAEVVASALTQGIVSLESAKRYCGYVKCSADEALKHPPEVREESLYPLLVIPRVFLSAVFISCGALHHVSDKAAVFTILGLFAFEGWRLHKFIKNSSAVKEETQKYRSHIARAEEIAKSVEGLLARADSAIIEISNEGALIDKNFQAHLILSPDTPENKSALLSSKTSSRVTVLGDGILLPKKNSSGRFLIVKLPSGEYDVRLVYNHKIELPEFLGVVPGERPHAVGVFHVDVSKGGSASFKFSKNAKASGQMAKDMLARTERGENYSTGLQYFSKQDLNMRLAGELFTRYLSPQGFDVVEGDQTTVNL